MRTIEELNALLGPLPGAAVPALLLPVQIQTRFVVRDGRSELLVRVYPDEIHLESHDPQLTDAEAQWGRAYWELIWSGAGDVELQRRAWEQLTGRFGASRAAWVSRRATPTNVAQRPGAPPVFPALEPFRDAAGEGHVNARLLPDRWIVIGHRGGQRVLLEAGAPIPDALPVGLGVGDATAPAFNDEELPLADGVRWMIDFEAAERVGMGVRAALAPADAGQPLDTLLVFGLRGAMDPEAATRRFEALLDGHRYTRGLAFVAPGTPTNNTAEESSGWTRRDPPPDRTFEVEAQPPRPADGSRGAVAADLLGVRRELFAVAGADGTDDAEARHMQTALWPVSGGYYLDQIMAAPAGAAPTVSEQQLDAARRHFIDFVRNHGPLPTIRVGRQPYGVLPAMSLDLLRASPGGATRFVETLRTLRGVWRSALPSVPRLAAGEQDDEQLVEILRIQPVSTGYRARLAFDADQFAAPGLVIGGLPKDLAAHSELLRRRLSHLVGGAAIAKGRLAEIIPAQAAVLLAARLVTPGGDPRDAPLRLNYLRFLLNATFDDIRHERLPGGAAPPDVLLYRLLRHSVLLAQATTARRILIRRGALADAPYREPALVDIAGGQKPGITLTLPRIIARDPALLASIHTTGAAEAPEAAALDELRRSLRQLSVLPVDTLERRLAECLDLFGHRLDAWITSLATRRLHELRAQRPRGLVIGGFGWVERLQPEPRTPVRTPPAGEDGAPLFAAREAGGCLHAPSMSHASAAAVLRSGFLSETAEAEEHPFAIDLRSRSVRLARWLLDGIGEGQALADLLGYRLERALHEQQLDRFVDALRRVSRLAEVYEAQDRVRKVNAEPAGPNHATRLKAARTARDRVLEALRRRYQWPDAASVADMERLAGEQVADGLDLAGRFRAGTVPFDRIGTNLPARVRRDLEAVLADLNTAVDALGDALTAEGVYQLVRGNPVRAGASVDAVAHGEIEPPELEVARTPRPGTPLTHRVVVLLNGSPAPAPSPDPRQARRAAEPTLDAWLRQLLGDLRNVRYGADFVDDSGAVLLQRRDLGLGALGISHLDAVYLAAEAQAGLPSGLERLLEHTLRRAAPETIPAGARVRLLAERPPNLPAAQLGLGEFLELLKPFRDTILTSRALDGRQLAPGEPEPGLDVADLRARADAAVAALRRATAGLGAARATAAGSSAVPEVDALRECLIDFVLLGFPDAVPLSARGTEPPAREPLLAQADAALREAGRRLESAADVDRAALSPEAQARHDQERLQAVFGPAFRVLALVRPSNRRELTDALGRSDELQGADPLQALGWLMGAGRVRPGASRLVVALTYAAALDRAAALELKVAQLPSEAGDRWVALPGAAFPPGRLSLVAHVPAPLRPDAPLAGLVVDEWVEVVPDADVTTGLAFNYEGAGARPPQAALLALAPPGSGRWEVEMLERTLLETFELARLRALDPQVLGGDELVERALPALYVSLNLAGDALSTDFAGLAS